MSTFLLWLTLPGAFAVLNRVWGGDPIRGWSGRRWAIIGVLGISVALCAALRLNPIVLAPVAWLIGRSIGFGTFGGSTTPRGWEQIAGAFVRFAIPAVIFSLASVITRTGLWYVPALLIYAVLATIASWLYAVEVMEMAADGEEEDGRLNARIELIQGGIYGGMVVLAFVIQGPV